VIILERLFPGVEIPMRATEGSAGYDLHAFLAGRTVQCSDGQSRWNLSASPSEEGAFAIALDPGIMALVPLGFRARLPMGVEAQIRPRSGAAFAKGLRIPNAPGTVDSDYPDEWMVLVQNGSAGPVLIHHGDRIAQMILARYEVIPITDGSVAITSERIGGFGSTGR